MDDEYEEFVYFSLQYDGFNKRIYYRNVEMIKNSDKIIFYVKNIENSGANKAMNYAKKLKKDFINIAEFI